MQYSKKIIHEVWNAYRKTTKKTDGQEKGQRKFLQIAAVDYIDHIQAALEPQLYSNGAIEMAAAMYRIGKRAGSTTLRGAGSRVDQGSYYEWGPDLERELANFASRALERVVRGGILDVESIETDTYLGPASECRFIPWRFSHTRSVRLLQLKIDIVLNKTLVSRVRSIGLDRGREVIVCSPWTVRDDFLDCSWFFGKGLVVGLLERWLELTDLHRQLLERANCVLGKPGDLLRDLSTSVSSYCACQSKSRVGDRIIVTAVYFGPDDATSSNIFKNEDTSFY